MRTLLVVVAELAIVVAAVWHVVKTLFFRRAAPRATWGFHIVAQATGRGCMRALIGIGSGVAAGLLFLIQAVGVVQWCPPWFFVMLHFPSTILLFALAQGTLDLGRSPSPYVVVLQWTSLGTLVGVILHLKHRSRASPSENDSDQAQNLASVPKARFSFVRVICVIVGLLFLLSLLFWAWVLSTPHH